MIAAASSRVPSLDSRVNGIVGDRHHAITGLERVAFLHQRHTLQRAGLSPIPLCAPFSVADRHSCRAVRRAGRRDDCGGVRVLMARRLFDATRRRSRIEAHREPARDTRHFGDLALEAIGLSTKINHGTASSSACGVSAGSALNNIRTGRQVLPELSRPRLHRSRARRSSHQGRTISPLRYRTRASEFHAVSVSLRRAPVPFLESSSTSPFALSLSSRPIRLENFWQAARWIARRSMIEHVYRGAASARGSTRSSLRRRRTDCRAVERAVRHRPDGSAATGRAPIGVAEIANDLSSEILSTYRTTLPLIEPA